MKNWIIGHHLQDFKYCDDHLEFEIFDAQNTEGIAIIADGVSSCDGGRIAAIVVCEALKKYFIEKRNESFYKNNPFILMENAFIYAGEQLIRIGNEINRNGIEFINNFLKNKISQPKILENLKKRINLNIENSIKQNLTTVFETTAILVYFIGNQLYLGMVGDGEIIQLIPPQIVTNYPQSKGSLITYFASNEGLRGPLRKIHLNIDKGGVFCFGSDGVRFGYYRKGGAPNSFFINILSKLLLNEKIQDFPKSWCIALQENNALEDDFSMFTLYLQNTQINPEKRELSIEDLSLGVKQIWDELQKLQSSMMDTLNSYKKNIEIFVKEKLNVIEMEKNYLSKSIDDYKKIMLNDVEREKDILSKSIDAMNEMEKNLRKKFEEKYSKRVKDFEKQHKDFKNKIKEMEVLNKNLDENKKELEKKAEYLLKKMSYMFDIESKSFEDQIEEKLGKFYDKFNIKISQIQDESIISFEDFFENKELEFNTKYNNIIEQMDIRFEDIFFRTERNLSIIENRIKANAQKSLKEVGEQIKYELETIQKSMQKKPIHES